MLLKHKISSNIKIKKPQNLLELKERLVKIKGAKISDLVELLEIEKPKNSVHAKGFVGQIIEYILGAHAKNQALPDFTNLDLELKTMPVDENLNPLESTFLCHANLKNVETNFYKSTLYKKIRFILFVFIKTSKNTNVLDREIVGFYFYKASDEDLKIFKADFDELNDLIVQGFANNINARIGTYIQMRPKCATGNDLTEYYDENCEIKYTRPRGFYLRRSFNKLLCQKVFFNK